MCARVVMLGQRQRAGQAFDLFAATGRSRTAGSPAGTAPPAAISTRSPLPSYRRPRTAGSPAGTAPPAAISFALGRRFRPTAGRLASSCKLQAAAQPRTSPTRRRTPSQRCWAPPWPRSPRTASPPPSRYPGLDQQPVTGAQRKPTPCQHPAACACLPQWGYFPGAPTTMSTETSCGSSVLNPNGAPPARGQRRRLVLAAHAQAQAAHPADRPCRPSAAVNPITQLCIKTGPYGEYMGGMSITYKSGCKVRGPLGVHKAGSTPAAPQRRGLPRRAPGDTPRPLLAGQLEQPHQLPEHRRWRLRPRGQGAPAPAPRCASPPLPAHIHVGWARPAPAHSRCCRVSSAQVRAGAWTDQLSFTTLVSKQTVIAGTGGGYAGDAAPGASYVLAGGPQGGVGGGVGVGMAAPRVGPLVSLWPWRRESCGWCWLLLAPVGGSCWQLPLGAAATC